MQYQQETFDLVENRFDKAQDYTEQAWTLVTNFMNMLQDPSLYFPDFQDLVETGIPPSIANTFNYNEPPFQSDLYDNLSAALTDLIENGGTGLAADVEAALWARARARQETVNERTYDEALNFFAARGWTMPPGALGGRLTEALAEQTRADAQINYEIMIEQARLAQKNTEFAMTVASDVTKGYFDFFTKLADRGLEAAKAAVTASVEIFKAEIEKFKARVELLIKNADVNMRMALEANSMKIETLKAGASVAAQLTASAMSGTAVGAHLSYQGGYNYGFSEATHQSQSESVSYNHNYEE